MREAVVLVVEVAENWDRTDCAYERVFESNRTASVRPGTTFAIWIFRGIEPLSKSGSRFWSIMVRRLLRLGTVVMKANRPSFSVNAVGVISEINFVFMRAV